MIASDLTDFPLLVKLSTTSGVDDDDMSAVFDELTSDSNRKKIAVTESDGTTELYVEIMKWDDANETALLWVKCDLSSSTDTILYLYYDSTQSDNTTYVGDIGDTAAQNVWNSSYEAVYHLTEQGNGTSNEYVDSTGNAHHGTADEGAGTEPTLATTGPLGVSQSFDGGDIIKLTFTGYKGAKTVEFLFADALTGEYFVSNGGAASGNYGIGINTDTSGYIRSDLARGSVGNWSFRATGGTDYTDSTWRYFAHAWDGTTTSNKARNYINGTEEGTTTSTHTEATDPTSPTTELGGYWYNSTYYPDYSGDLAEVRFSTVDRGEDWIDASYASIWDDLVKFSEENWLGTWANRVSFEISSSVIDGDLTNFPVALSIDSACGIGADDLTVIFTEIVYADRKKIAVTSSNGSTELYVEIENWDDTNEKALLHTKVPSVSSSSNTTIYLYYDSSQSDNTTYVGDVNSTPGGSVWDSDFVGVYHFTDTDTPDSTSNNNDGTGSGSPSIVDNNIGGKAIELSGTNEYVNMASGTTLDDIALLTVETFFNADDYGENNTGRLVDKTTATNNGWSVVVTSSGLGLIRDSSGGLGQWYGGTITTGGTTWHYGAITHNNGDINNDPVVHLDGTKPSVSELATPSGTWDVDTTANMLVGIRTGDDREFDGKISEVRISKIIRDDEWLKASYHSLYDSLGTWGSIQSEGENGNGEEEGIPYPKVVINGKTLQVSDTRVLINGKWLSASGFSVNVAGKWLSIA